MVLTGAQAAEAFWHLTRPVLPGREAVVWHAGRRYAFRDAAHAGFVAGLLGWDGVSFSPTGGLMSWGFTATARTKANLKEHSRKQLLLYQPEGTPGHTLMSRVADHVDGLIDLFNGTDGRALRLETSGHLDNAGVGNCKLELTNHCGTFLD